MVGPSITPACHGHTAVSRREGPPRSDKPSDASGCAHRLDGRPWALSSLFHTRNGRPRASTNGLGSIDPGGWQMSGRVGRLLYGPRGSDATATPMHWTLVPARWAVKYITHRPPSLTTPGAQVRPTSAHDGRTGSGSTGVDHV